MEKFYQLRIDKVLTAFHVKSKKQCPQLNLLLSASDTVSTLAQDKNADGKHLYGCYVKENNWHFTTLLGLDYCVSRQFDSTQKHDLLQIVYSLRKLKDLILNR